MRTIRASEIGSYIYCQRAWWYFRQGVQPGNPAELSAGFELHARHSRAALVSGCLKILAYSTLLAAMVLLIIHFGSLFL